MCIFYGMCDDVIQVKCVLLVNCIVVHVHARHVWIHGEHLVLWIWFLVVWVHATKDGVWLCPQRSSISSPLLEVNVGSGISASGIGEGECGQAMVY